MVLLVDEEFTAVFADDLPLRLVVRVFLEIADRCLKVPRASQTICADWSQVRQNEVRFKGLTYVAAVEAALAVLAVKLRIAVDHELDTARNDADLQRLDNHAAKLGRDVEVALLRYDEPVTIGREECRIRAALIHVLVKRISVDAQAVLHLRFAGAAHLKAAFDEVEVTVLFNLHRLPSFLVRTHFSQPGLSHFK